MSKLPEKIITTREKLSPLCQVDSKGENNNKTIKDKDINTSNNGNIDVNATINNDDDDDDDSEELQLRREPTMLRRGKKLIAPSSNIIKKYTVVFDLDETVINWRGSSLHTREHLKNLLRALKEDFEIIVWTAGVRSYAKKVLEEINEDHIIEHLISRHRSWYKSEDYTKDLTKLGRDLNYTIIIENTPDCVRANPCNGIIVKDFEVLEESENGNNDRSKKLEDKTEIVKRNDKKCNTKKMLTNEEYVTNTNQQNDKFLNNEENSLEYENNVHKRNYEICEKTEVSYSHASLLLESDKNNEELQTLSYDSEKLQKKKSESTLPQRQRRKWKDRTLFLLEELLLGLVESGKTVPEYLSTCKLLSRQCIETCDGLEIPIYHLGTRRRRKDAGISRKITKSVNELNSKNLYTDVKETNFDSNSTACEGNK